MGADLCALRLVNTGTGCIILTALSGLLRPGGIILSALSGLLRSPCKIESSILWLEDVLPSLSIDENVCEKPSVALIWGAPSCDVSLFAGGVDTMPARRELRGVFDFDRES